MALSLGGARTYSGRGWKFIPNRSLERDLQRDTRFKAAEKSVAEQTRDAIAERAPRSDIAHKHLADSGVVEEADGHFQVSFGEGLDSDRAVPVEYGTEDTPAEPYMRPGAETMGTLKDG